MVTWGSAASSKISMEPIFVSSALVFYIRVDLSFRFRISTFDFCKQIKFYYEMI